MKTFFQQLVTNAKVKCGKPGVFSRGNTGGKNGFDPAPFYWALIPVKPQKTERSKSVTDFDDCI